MRFWLVDTWGHLAANIDHFKQDIAIEPPDRNPNKKAYALLFETAVQGKAENIPKRLGGELARAILSGGHYPHTLFTAVVGRIRADKRINAARAGLCKAVIMRNFGREDVPVALDTDSDDGAYNLGRLFAVYEYAEKSVADRNATIRDKFIGAASATPRRVFPILMRGYEHNASTLAKGDGNQRGAGVKASKAVAQILGAASAARCRSRTRCGSRTRAASSSDTTTRCRRSTRRPKAASRFPAITEDTDR